jgi:hypothetical protein
LIGYSGKIVLLFILTGGNVSDGWNVPPPENYLEFLILAYYSDDYLILSFIYLALNTVGLQTTG